ncbi:MAG TPA: hypothetical protein VNJ01_04805 [Bacteriovoracaceae bacterium]|nr:hypothetical protein [Bacteriovoracaceae bacterium]
MKIILMLLLSFNAIAAQNIEEAKKSIATLIKPLLPGQPNKRPPGTEKFRVDKCEKEKINWGDVLLMKSDASLNYKFKEGCDIEGSIQPKIFSEFPANLNLRNLNSYKKIQSSNKITATLESKPILNLAMREGVLSGKDRMKFEVDYQVQINPTSTSKPVEKNLGGELRITEINGQKASIKEKIVVD